MSEPAEIDPIDLLIEIHKLEVRIVVLEAQVTALMDREFPPVSAEPGQETEPEEA